MSVVCDFATLQLSAAPLPAVSAPAAQPISWHAATSLHFTSTPALSAGYQSKPKKLRPTRSTSGARHLEAAASISEFARSARGANPQCDHVLAATAAAIHFTVAATARPLNERNFFIQLTSPPARATTAVTLSNPLATAAVNPAFSLTSAPMLPPTRSLPHLRNPPRSNIPSETKIN